MLQGFDLASPDTCKETRPAKTPAACAVRAQFRWPAGVRAQGVLLLADQLVDGYHHGVEL
jgi:hypothetical protein